MGICMASSFPIVPVTYSMEEMEKKLNIARAFPSWCIPNPVITPEVLSPVKDSWKKITSGDNKAFTEFQKSSQGKDVTPIVFFYNTFYNEFFKLDPEAKKMFSRGIHSQGQVLANIISYIVKCAENDVDSLVTTLQKLAITHNKRGILAHYYSSVGMVLL
jgi:hypothetical protein